jgi:DNA-binding NarL/FixJ family response regulator
MRKDMELVRGGAGIRMTDEEGVVERMDPSCFDDADRRNCRVLVVEPDTASREFMRRAVLSLGCGGVSDAPDHARALRKLELGRFTHVIFDAGTTSMTASEFLQRALEGSSDLIAIPTSNDPAPDHVFGLLVLGAGGFLRKPFEAQVLENVLMTATLGDRFSEAFLVTGDRNKALASLILTSLDRLATTLRHNNRSESAAREVHIQTLALKQAMDLGRTFASDGADGLLSAIVDLFLDFASGPATRLRAV